MLTMPGVVRASSGGCIIIFFLIDSQILSLWTPLDSWGRPQSNVSIAGLAFLPNQTRSYANQQQQDVGLASHRPPEGHSKGPSV
jgi:hypothetical protein